jgi:acyl-CoA synthetase (AMP-forming)/AMP-acid ligase II
MTKKPTLIHHFLEGSAAARPDAVAVVQGQERRTYADLNRQANRLAHDLIEEGVRPGDRVVLISENSADYIIAYYGILKAGGVSVSLNPDLRPGSLRELLKELEPKSIIVSPRSEPVLRSVHPRSLGIEDVRVLGPRPEAPSSGGQGPDVSVGPGDLAMIVYTSGSAGRPKGVMLTHANIVANTRSTVAFLELGARDIQMVVLPFFYVMGKSLLNTHFAVGGRVVLNNTFGYTAAVLKQMAAEGVTGFSGVPSTYAHLLFRSPLARYRDKLPELRYCSQAGGHMSKHIKFELLKVLPPQTRLVVMYGATEASARLTFLPPERLLEKIDSIGKPIPGVTLKVLSPTGEPLGPGRTGELVASGDNIMSGYYRDEKATARALDRHGYHTGDLGHLDEDGFFYVTGRKDDQVKVSGHRVDPQEIEDVIMESGRAVECLVLGIPDALAGYRLVGLIVPADEDPGAAGAVERHCRERLPKFKAPETFVTIEAIPKTAVGKPDRPAGIRLYEKLYNRGARD